MDEFSGLLIIMVVVWVMGKIFRYFHLPVIFGELVGGILVGPVVFGIVDPESHMIKVLAELGIFFLMLHAGLESHPKELLKASSKSVFVALGGVVVPFVLGYYTSIYFGQSHSESLFIAMGLSITAIAISVRLFKDFKMMRTKVANLTISAAIIDDIIALMLFSVVLSLAEGSTITASFIFWMVIKLVVFFGVVIVGGMKTSKYFGKVLRNKGFTTTLIVALLLGLIAESIGLHMIVGAFLAGLFISEELMEEKTFHKIEDRIYGIAYGFLGPIFFTSLAFYLDFTSIYTAPYFLIAILLVATLGKILGSGLAALVQKISFKNSLIVGVAMNSRGAVELVIASIGFQKGIINQEVFSILVIMAFATTIFSIFAMKPLAKKKTCQNEKYVA